MARSSFTLRKKQLFFLFPIRGTNLPRTNCSFLFVFKTTHLSFVCLDKDRFHSYVFLFLFCFVSPSRNQLCLLGLPSYSFLVKFRLLTEEFLFFCFASSTISFVFFLTSLHLIYRYFSVSFSSCCVYK